MHNKKIRKLLQKTKLNSGFTLIELLTGLFMSVFVTGALGFGLYQILQATAREKAKTDTRNEASRAVEFISDELRRASTIEVNADNADGVDASDNLLFDPTGKTVVLALNIPEINESDTLGSDDNLPTFTSERIVYYLEASSGNWQGPQVLYRWGPPLDANGNYTTGNWQAEALIDGIDDTIISADPCGGDILTPPLASNPSGFYACVNGTNTAAQIFLTGGIDTDAIAGNDSNYTAETRAVARAKNATVSSAVPGAVPPITIDSLVADYVSDPNFDAQGRPVYDVNGDVISYWDADLMEMVPATPQTWTMRMDFDNNPYNSSETDNAAQWIHETGRQAQPISIDPGHDLRIYSIPVGQASALSNGNFSSDGFSENTNLSDFLNPNPDPNLFSRPGYTVSHTIKFQASASGRSDDADFYKTFNGDNSGNNYNNPNVDPSGKVIVLKRGSVLDPDATIDTASAVAAAPLYGGYDFDNDPNTDSSETLGEFLVAKGLADDNNDGTYTINNNLGEDERIIAFETGQDDNGFGAYDTGGDNEPHPGFDMQDNVLIMRHDIFAADHQ